MDASSPPPTGLAFWTPPIVAGLCSSDFQEWQRLCHVPPSLAVLSLGADTQAQCSSSSPGSPTWRWCPLFQTCKSRNNGGPALGSLCIAAPAMLCFIYYGLYLAHVDWLKELLSQLLSAIRGQVVRKQCQAGVARHF